MASSDFLRSLAEVVGGNHVLTAPDMTAGYVRDWTGRWLGSTLGVVRPGSVAEVQEVLARCGPQGTAVVPQGGNTGLVGGSVPHHGEIVLSLRRLDELGASPVGTAEVVAGGGTTIASLQRHARGRGLEYGVDLASRESATVGGTIATNAGGSRVVAHGDTRSQLLGLQVVLADGTLVDQLLRPPKRSLGPDLLQLMPGSEGSLGVVTAARLRLVVPPTSSTVTLIGLDRLEDGLKFLDPGVQALEFFDRSCLLRVCDHLKAAPPLPGDRPFYVLVESADLPPVPEHLEAVVDPRLWRFRESITETLNLLGVPHKLDVAVPLDSVDRFAKALADARLPCDLYLFGHLAEGNFHVNFLNADRPEAVADQILDLVVGMGGVIASEHGIGVAKAGWWRRTLDPWLLGRQRQVKEAFDPRGLLNPAVFWGGSG